MQVEHHPIKYLSQFLLTFCAAIIIFTIKSTAKIEDEPHAVIEDVLHYVTSVEANSSFKSRITRQGEQLIKQKFRSGKALLKRVDGRRFQMFGIAWAEPYQVHLDDNLKPVESMVTVPSSALSYSHPNLKTAVLHITEHGKEQSTVSIPDYPTLLGIINRKIQAVRGSFYECVVHVQGPEIVHILEGMTARVDTIKTIPVTYEIEFYRTPGEAIYEKPTIDIGPKTLALAMKHYPLQASSFADYMAYKNASQHVVGLTYDSLVYELRQNEAKLRKYYPLDLYLAASASAPKPTDNSLNLFGFTISSDISDIIFGAFPVLLLVVLYLIFTSAEAAIKESEATAEHNVHADNLNKVHKEMMPFPVRSIQRWNIWLYFLLIPVATLAIALFLRGHKLPSMFPLYYVVVGLLCVLLVYKLAILFRWSPVAESAIES